METNVVCPKCRAENLPGALTCYRCNSPMPSAPSWVGPAKFRPHDAAKDKPFGWIPAAVGSVFVIIFYFLAWIGVPKGVTDSDTRGTSAFDILLGSTGAKSAIGNGGVGTDSVGFDVRFLVFLMLVAAFVTLLLAIFRPTFLPMLISGLVALAVPIYFFIMLAVRNSSQFNTPDLVGLLRFGFYGTLVGTLLMIFGAIGCRRYALMTSISS